MHMRTNLQSELSVKSPARDASEEGGWRIKKKVRKHETGCSLL